MSKPDWCPQRVWDDVEGIFLSNGGRMTIARAILAAEQREREACAQVAETMRTPYTKDGRFISSEQNRVIADAIRNRGSSHD